jgi:hypothetical protein
MNRDYLMARLRGMGYDNKDKVSELMVGEKHNLLIKKANKYKMSEQDLNKFKRGMKLKYSNLNCNNLAIDPIKELIK